MTRANLVLIAAFPILSGAIRGADSAYNLAVLQDAPLFYWTFDEADGDPAVNRVQPAVPGDALLPEGTAGRVDQAAAGGDPLLGRSADFDGLPGSRFFAADIGGTTHIPGADSIPSQIWAIELWFQVQGANDGQRADYLLESWGLGGANDPGIIYDFTEPDYLELFKGNRTGSLGPQASDNEWHHLVLAFYGNGAGLGVADRRDIYLDGAPFTESSSGFSSGFALVELALGNTVAAGGVNGFEGRIDEVAIHDIGAKLADQGLDITIHNPDAESAMETLLIEIADHSTKAQSPGYREVILAAEPLFYWSFDEAGDAEDAVNLADPSDARDHLAAQGAATRVSHQDSGSGLLLGRAASFDGANGTRFYAANLDASVGPKGLDMVPTQLWALEMWVQVQGDNTGHRGDYLLESEINDPGVIFDYTDPDYLELYKGNRTGTTGPQISDDRWHHLVFAFYGNAGGFGVANRREIVIDGQAFNESASGFSSGFSLIRLALGNSVGGPQADGFQGRIDEVALYDLGAKLVAAGKDISQQNADAEAAFEALVLDISDHRKLVAGFCQETADAVAITGPADALPGSPVDLVAELTGIDPGGQATYDWSILGGDATLTADDEKATVTPAGPGEVTVQVIADDGACPTSASVRATHRICFETPDGVTINGPDQTAPGQPVTLTAAITGLDAGPYVDTSSTFSAGFGVVEIGIGNTAFSGGVNGFEGKMDEVAIYDIGNKLAAGGIDIAVRTPEAQAAFAAEVRKIAAHSSLRGAAYAAAVIADQPEFYWTFDEDGDLADAVNQMDPADLNDDLLAQGNVLRVSHADLGDGLDLGRAAQFDGANGTRFFAPDLNGPGTDPGQDLLTTQLWAFEFWFQVDGPDDASRGDYFCEVIGPNGITNNPGIIYDFDFDPGVATPRDYLEMFGGGGRTGSAGPVVRDGNWHHAVFAFYGNSAGFGVANRRDIVVDGGAFPSVQWSIVSGAAELVPGPGGTASVTGTGQPGDQVVVRVETRDGPCAGASAERTIALSGTAGKVFHRGDVDDTGAMDITDAVVLLGYLFLGTATLPCKESADADDNGQLELTDVLVVLNYLFLGGPPPESPGPVPGACGPDRPSTPADLGCESYVNCP